ncbi:hypothetical protein CFOL_v3_31244 [Cephalotus follicularis]|uniref:Uncharacterized protein n=1 Tax=Cephalotus follicularis TaxID=3775 RepID=A0A1Q3D6E2_CEPFO|nr:hypothetical protein CFOL_v3_31244 [Cephalotus follicularis]
MKLEVQSESPIKVYTAKNENQIAELGFKPQSSTMTPIDSFRDLSSKDEMFFESHPWLESDCEDYFSVNGDLTPSRVSSPIHPNSYIDAPPLDKTLFVDNAPISIPEPSPTTIKKQLIELFRESFSREHAESNQDLQGWSLATLINFDHPPRSTFGSPYVTVPNSVCSSEASPFRCSYSKKQKSTQSAQCCFPSLVRRLNFSERKKRLIPSNNGKQ